MTEHDSFFRRQLQSLCGLALLSPILRLIPGSAAEQAGRAAWAAPLLALPVLLLYAWALSRLRSSMQEGESLPDFALRLLGARLGRGFLLLLGGWLLLYCAFTLRAGADRFLVTVYPRSAAANFVIPMGLLALLAALGPLKSLLRAARMAEPLLLSVLLVLLLAGLWAADWTELMPLTPADAGHLLRGSWPSLDIAAFGLAAYFFFLPGQPRETGSFRRKAGLLALFTLGLTVLGAAVQGRFGAPLCARLSAPFFALVRNLVFFRSLERVEALVVGLWILPDFLLTGLCLQAGQRCLRLACGYSPQPGERRLDFANGRWLIWLGGLAAIGLGLVLAPEPASLLFWSRRLIPALSLAAALLIPGLLFLGLILIPDRKL